MRDQESKEAGGRMRGGCGVGKRGVQEDKPLNEKKLESLGKAMTRE